MTMTANLADGRVLNFPDGTDPSVIQSTVKKMIAGAGQEQPVSQPVPQPVAQPQARPSMSEMFAKYTAGEFSPGAQGAFEELARRQFAGGTMGVSEGSPFKQPAAPGRELSVREQGMAELAADTGFLETLGVSFGRGLGNVATGLNLGPEFGDFGDPNEAIQKEAMTALEEERPVTTMVGEAAGEAAPFLVAGGPLGALESQTARVLGTGALTATEGGVIQAGRGEDVLKGTAIGGVIGMGAEILFPVLGKLGRKVFQRVTGKAPKGAMLDAAGNPTQELEEVLAAANMTFDDLKEDAVVSIGAASGKFDPTQMARKEFLESQGITPTKAQVTRAATDFQAQQEAAKTSTRVRSALEGQEAHLTTRFDDTVSKVAGDSQSPSGNVVQAVTDKATVLDKEISALYKEAKELAPDAKNIGFGGVGEKLKRLLPRNTKTGGNIEAIIGEMQYRGLLDDNLKPTGRTDVANAEDLRIFVNSLFDRNNPVGNMALREVKDALDDDVFKTAGEDVFNRARSAKAKFEGDLTRAKVSKFDSRRQNLVRDMLENKIDPDQFVDKVVFGRGWRVEDIKQLKNYISDATGSPLNDLRAETLDNIKDRAFIGAEDANGFRALSRHKLTNILEKQIGWKKLEALFEPEEVGFLRDMLKVANMREPVRGTALGRGPSAQAIQSLENKLKEIPGLSVLVKLIDFDAQGRAALKASPEKLVRQIGATERAIPSAVAAAGVAPTLASQREETQ